jgi:hypothetical protein
LIHQVLVQVLRYLGVSFPQDRQGIKSFHPNQRILRPGKNQPQVIRSPPPPERTQPPDSRYGKGGKIRVVLQKIHVLQDKIQREFVEFPDEFRGPLVGNGIPQDMVFIGKTGADKIPFIGNKYRFLRKNKNMNKEESQEEQNKLGALWQSAYAFLHNFIPH